MNRTMNILKRTFYVLWFLIGTSVISSAFAQVNHKPKDTLSVDNHIGPAARFAFPNDEDIHPSNSDFESLNFVPLSSESGERWAAITLTNTSSGQRFLTQDNLIGLFADGRRISPSSLKEKFDGKETRTLNVYFGRKKFPLLDLYTLKDEQKAN